MTDDYQIETAIAAVGSRLSESQCGGYVEAGRFQDPLPRAQERFVVGNGKDGRSPVCHRDREQIKNRNFGVLSSWILARVCSI